MSIHLETNELTGLAQARVSEFGSKGQKQTLMEILATSSAISLKRIADSLARLEKKPSGGSGLNAEDVYQMTRR